MIFFIGLRWCSRSIQAPDIPFNASTLSGRVRISVSNRPTRLVEAALWSTARPPTTRRIAGSTEKPLGVVRVFVTSEPTDDRLPELSAEQMLSVLAVSHIVQTILCDFGQAERFVELAIGEQPCIGSDRRSMEFKPYSVVEIHENIMLASFTYQIPRFPGFQDHVIPCLIVNANTL
jgi:hypothetical protein